MVAPDCVQKMRRLGVFCRHHGLSRFIGLCAVFVPWTVMKLRLTVCIRFNPSPNEGVVQLSTDGYPMKIVDHDNGHIWSVPVATKAGPPYALAHPKNDPTAIIPGEDGTNLNYGTLQTITGRVLNGSRAVHKTPPKALEAVPPIAVPGPAAVPQYGVTSGNLMTQRQPEAGPPTKMGNLPVPTRPELTAPPPLTHGSQYGMVPMLAAHRPPPFPPLSQPPPMIFNTSPGGGPAGKGVSNPLDVLIRIFGSIIGMLLGGLNINLPYFSLSFPKLASFGGFSMGNANLGMLFNSVVKENAKMKNLDALAPIDDPICKRDYSAQCPNGWTPISDNSCKAPEAYAGACAHVIRTEPLNAQQKAQLATECKVSWKCLSSLCNNFDYTTACPESWTFAGDCIPPTFYKGPCIHKQDLKGFSEAQKEQFALSCQVSWRCIDVPCKQDFSRTCPQDWKFDDSSDTCVAPAGSRAGCLQTPFGIQNMSPSEREAFAGKCGISYPCLTHKKNCQSNFSAACPTRWTNIMQSGACEAPQDYTPSKDCPDLVHFDFKGADERLDFATRCHVTWPCIEDASRNYDSPCPLQFEEKRTGQEIMCTPTSKYAGPCKEAINFAHMTIGEKASFEELCNAQFPSVHHVQGVYSASNLLRGTAASMGVTYEI